MEEEEEGGRGGDAGRLCLPAAPAAPAECTEGPAPAPQVGDRDGDRVTPKGLQGHLRAGEPPRAGNLAHKVRPPPGKGRGPPQVGTTPGVGLGILPPRRGRGTPQYGTRDPPRDGIRTAEPSWDETRGPREGTGDSPREGMGDSQAGGHGGATAP